LHFTPPPPGSDPTLLLLAVYALVYLQFALQLAGFPFDLDQGEGYDAWSGWLMNLGQLPYTTNADFPYYSSNYPPLWSYIVSIPMAWLGPGLSSRRVVYPLILLSTWTLLWMRPPVAVLNIIVITRRHSLPTGFPSTFMPRVIRTGKRW